MELYKMSAQLNIIFYVYLFHVFITDMLYDQIYRLIIY